jgi:hypothetical protein
MRDARVMRRTLPLLVLALSAVALPTRATDAKPLQSRQIRLIDCACYDIFAIRPNGRGAHRLLRNEGQNLFDVSRDLARILFSHRVNSLSSATVGGHYQRILASVGVNSARWSPDGASVLYATSSGSGACVHATLHVVGSNGLATGLSQVPARARRRRGRQTGERSLSSGGARLRISRACWSSRRQTAPINAR